MGMLNWDGVVGGESVGIHWERIEYITPILPRAGFGGVW